MSKDVIFLNARLFVVHGSYRRLTSVLARVFENPGLPWRTVVTVPHADGFPRGTVVVRSSNQRSPRYIRRRVFDQSQGTIEYSTRKTSVFFSKGPVVKDPSIIGCHGRSGGVMPSSIQ